jgi:hypothetical protein
LLSPILAGEAQYHALLERRQALSPSPLEEAWVDFMLDALRSRLRYLEKRMGMTRRSIRKSPASHIVPGGAC